MDNQRRKKISKIEIKIEELSELLKEIELELEGIRDEEQEYLDSIPEILQSSEKYEKAENATSVLDNAYEWISQIDVEELTRSLYEAKL